MAKQAPTRDQIFTAMTEFQDAMWLKEQLARVMQYCVIKEQDLEDEWTWAKVAHDSIDPLAPVRKILDEPDISSKPSS